MSDYMEISGFHRYLRKSKAMKPARVVYSVVLGIIRYGFKYEMKWLRDKLHGKIMEKRYYKHLIISEEERMRQEGQQYDTPVCFSILVPLYNTPEKYLREMIGSVQDQTYPDWQLCLADGSDEAHARVGEIVREYSREDGRICYERLERNEGISGNTNACIRMARGTYIVLFDHDDMLHKSALYELRKAVDETGADFIYTDEAVFSKDPHHPDSYHFKTDFAIDDLRANNYICHITCFSTALLKRLGEGFRQEYDGSQDFDLVLRLSEKAEKIVHIPQVLYYWRCHAASVASDISAKTYCIDAGKKAVESHLERMGVQAEVRSSEVYPVIYRVTYPVQGMPRVSVIVWGRTDIGEIDRCISEIREHTHYQNYDVISCEDISQRDRIADHTGSEYLVFMDARCQCREDRWLEEMLGVAQRPEVGAVGCKILYTNDIIRDAGVALGIGEDGLGANRFYRLGGDCPGYMGNLYYTHDVSAVTDACLMIRKEYFQEAGGFDAQLPEWYAGIDLSMKLMDLQKINVVNPYAILHYRDMEKKRDSIGRYQEYRDHDKILRKRWGKKWEAGDMYYNGNLSQKTCDFTVG